MTEVTIDGKRYIDADEIRQPIVPRVGFAPTIGIGITTKDRHDVLQKSLTQHAKHLPPNARVAVVNDGGNFIPVDWSGLDRYRDVHLWSHPRPLGIARAKNRCLAMLDDCDHVFLFDDDAYPVDDDWWMPYVYSPEPHLMYQFADLAGPRKLNDIHVLYEDDQHIAYTGPRGVMLYFERRVIDAVGGYDPIYGSFGYEHGDLSNRIHAAGFTSWRFADVKAARDRIHSMDEYEEVTRTTTPRERQEAVKRNIGVYNERMRSGYTAFVPYRESTRDVVLTSFFTSQPDPQRHKTIAPGTAAALSDDLKRFGVESHVFTDNGLDAGFLTVGRQLVVNPYFERHLAAWQWLRDNPDVAYAWCIDATDVRLQNHPFQTVAFEPGKLHIGYELTTLGSPWMLKHHPSKLIQTFLTNNPSETLLNAGIIGGDRATMMEFLHHVVRVFFDIELAQKIGVDNGGNGVGDMAVVNYVARTYFADRLIYGPSITTAFRHDETNDFSIWRHK